MNDNAKKRRWYSKTGIIVIICVAGFGGSILIPTVVNVTYSTSTPWAQIHLGEIAKTYLTFSYNGSTFHQLKANPEDTAHKAAYILAKYAGLNDASIYFIKSDARAPKNPPKQILFNSEYVGSPPALNPEFMKSVLSFEIVANLPRDAPPTTTPIAWERGLREDGTWAPDSPWGGGGHIAYLDGHVEWADKLTLDGECFTTYPTRPNGGKPTVNIREALPPGAVILSAEPNKK